MGRLSLLFTLNFIMAANEALVVAALYPLSQALTVGTSNPAANGQISKTLVWVNWLTTHLPGGHPVIQAALLLMTAFILKSVLGFLIEIQAAKVSSELVVDLKERMFNRFMKAPYTFFLDQKIGSLTYQCLSAPHKPGLLILSGLQAMVEVFRFSGMIVLLALVQFKVTLAVLALGGTFSILSSMISRRVLHQAGHRRMEAGKEQSVILTEFLSGIKHLRVFRAMERWHGLFSSAAQRYCDLNVHEAFWLALSGRTFETAGVVGCCVLLIGATAWRPDMIATFLPYVAVFLFAFLRLIPSVVNFSRLRVQYIGAVAESESVYELLHQAEEEKRPSASALALPQLPRIQNEIRLESVSYAHAGNEILHQVSLVIPRGKTTAIVGASGAGKTTIINLLLGLLQPTSGKITVDGQDLSSFDPESWLKRIGYVGQDFFIFNGSVRNNISLGRPCTEEELISATRLADAHGFISQLPQGYETHVGDRGLKISGGQQQRVAISRAMLGSPEMLVLDEATSALDNASELNIQQTLSGVSGEKTVLIVAHRLTSVRVADHIVVLRNGRVFEAGSFSDLMSAGGEFARLYGDAR
jgi:subfamily B ATP-binding cassette protein MsbA